jgi:hypothetical protein
MLKLTLPELGDFHLDPATVAPQVEETAAVLRSISAQPTDTSGLCAAVLTALAQRVRHGLHVREADTTRSLGTGLSLESRAEAAAVWMMSSSGWKVTCGSL